jgi:signal peptidase I
VTYSLGEDQFFPLGDNSPQSKDARLWSHKTTAGLEPPPFVHRDMLIGKAVFIYWPHGWRILTDFVGIIPNYQRIGRIR